MSDRSSEGSHMTDMVMDEMNLIVREAMAPWAPGDSIKAGLNRAAAKLKMEHRRVRGIYYREARAILAHEADKLRAWHREQCDRELEWLEQRKTELLARKTSRKSQHVIGLGFLDLVTADTGGLRHE